MTSDLQSWWQFIAQLPLIPALLVGVAISVTVGGFLAIPIVLLLQTEPRAIARAFSGARTAGVATRVAAILEAINTAVGQVVAWLTLIMALTQLTVVVLRYVFSVGWIPMQESVWYMHGLLFTLGAGYTLARDGHVRLDIFYRGASARHKAWIDLLGVVLLLLPLCTATWWWSLDFVANAWSVKEGSMEVSGLPYLYLLKTALLAFAVLLALQGVALALRCIERLRARPGPYDR